MRHHLRLRPHQPPRLVHLPTRTHPHHMPQRRIVNKLHLHLQPGINPRQHQPSLVDVMRSPPPHRLPHMNQIRLLNPRLTLQKHRNRKPPHPLNHRQPITNQRPHPTRRPPHHPKRPTIHTRHHHKRIHQRLPPIRRHLKHPRPHQRRQPHKRRQRPHRTPIHQRPTPS